MDMEHDADLAPALERVTASVAETQRRRLDLERELSGAATLIASLKNQSSALEMSLLDLQRQLDYTLQAKAEEDTALAEIARQKEEALRDLATLRETVNSLITQKQKTAESLSNAFADVRSRIDAVSGHIDSTSKAAAAMAGEVQHLRDRVTAVREATDAADRQLADVANKSAAVNDAVALLRSDAEQIGAGLRAIAKKKEEADVVAGELGTLMTALQGQRSEAEAAAESMRKVIASRRQQTKAISEQMQAITALIAPAQPNGSAGSASPTPPTSVTPPVNTAPASPPVVPSASALPTPLPVPEPATNGAATVTPGASGRVSFPRTTGAVRLLASENFLGADEAARIIALLDEGEVNKVVRSLWSRAVGGTTPGVYRLIIADALNESGDFKAAMTFYNQALATRHLDPFLTYLVAASLFTAAKSEDALKIGKLLAREKSGKVLSRNIEAIYYMRSGKLDEAERRLSEALATTGVPRAHHNETLYNMALLQKKKGDAAASDSWTEKLRAADPAYRQSDVPMVAAPGGE